MTLPAMATYVGNALYAHANGGCYVCRRGDSLVDTDVQIVGEGALVLCAGCVQELAETAGLTMNIAALAEERAAFAEERQTFAPERVRELEAEVAELRQALDVSQRVEARLQSAIEKLTKGTKSEARRVGVQTETV